jgi:NAD(P)-dependent dehydrogenase (short-subunit alcohol dehydrogenase family)
VSPGAPAPLRYDGRVALVTGAGRNLGRAYARLLAARGARVVVNDLGIAVSDTDGSGAVPERNPALDVVDEIVAAGGEAVANTDSITTVAGGEAMVRQALDTFGRLDIVILNAGVVRQAPFPDLTPDLVDPVLDTQIGGVFHVARPAWRAMSAAGYGRILALSSGAAVSSPMGMAAYAAGKAAVVGLTRVMALEGRACGIQVNALMPIAKTRPDTGFGAIPPSVALQDWLSVDHVAALAAWLVHEDCPASGEVFSVGGGYAARVVFAVTPGFAQRPLSPEDARDHFDEILATDPATLRVLAAGEADADRMLAGFVPPAPA